MRNLLKMQILLNVRKPMWLFALFGAMVLIPNYPYMVGAGYVMMVVFNYLTFLNQDMAMQFTAMLPISRKDVVSSTTAVVCLFELSNLAVSALLAYPAFLLHGINPVGIDANLSYFGISLVCFGIFNLVLLPRYFKTAYKAGLPALFGSLAFLATYGGFEALVQALPVLNQTLDGYNPNFVWMRAIILLVGATVFITCTLAANTIAAKRFEEVNL